MPILGFAVNASNESENFHDRILVFQLGERAIRSRVTLREEGQVELEGKRLTDLARVRLCQIRTDSVNYIYRLPLGVLKRLRVHRQAQLNVSIAC